MFCEKIVNQKGGMCWSIVMMEQPLFSPSHQAFVSSLPLSLFITFRIIFLVHHLAKR
jgi:hypothetical protein